MSLLLETIPVRDRQFLHLPYHQARMDQSRAILFRTARKLELSEIPIPDYLPSAWYKCRVLYGEKIERVEFIPYLSKRIRSLKLVQADDLEYPFKYADRSLFHHLLEKHPECDEIIIVKGGLITDTSFTNLAFYSDSCWYTPAAPLLKGTCRQRLIDHGLLKEADLRVADILKFRKISLINAFLDLNECILPVKNIW